MKKYIICDVLTWGRLLFLSTLMLICALTKLPLWVGLVAYVVGVLSDMDGYFARKYPYPKDGRYRWWRAKKFIALLDEVADVVFGINVLVFFICRIDTVAGMWFLVLALNIGILVQIVLKVGILKHRPGILNFILLCRRILYFTLIGVVLVMITLAAFPRYSLIAIGVYLAIALLVWRLGMINMDRLTKGDKD